MLRKTMILLAMTSLVLAGCKSTDLTRGNITVSESPQSTAVSSPGQSTTVPTTPAASATSSPVGRGNDAVMTNVTALRLADAKQGWIGGAGWIAHTDNGGAKWQVQYKGAGEIAQIFALNDREAWASVKETSQLLHTTDRGEHWAAVGKVPNHAFFHSVSGQEAFSGNAQTVNGGTSWVELPIPTGLTGDAYFHDKKNGWGARQKQNAVEVLRTQDGGRTWQTVMSRNSAATLTDVVIRSASADDAWIELVGGSGMSQTSYSLFHTKDGGKTWQTVLVNSTAGGGPAPGLPMGETAGAKNKGSKPGPLYVVNPDVAFMGGSCPACDKPNSVGWTTDGGKTWVNGTESFTGYGELQLGMADASGGWLITNGNEQPSVMYTTSNGGVNWTKVHTFDAP
ncbi:WD40/YVTN/BNR-like repeat-containing protein [Paenibacillus roseipurpureus]|uniref:YCF48-related protein n=1 Tax=Paenibacillus roseopurpureus TaxID=2918901 RepID=A0AA96LL75_9BACL|nr:YCF48-related protein [Paenibacillus sp. MBLB1832]WNR43937.1 YCF48-related protein [Paenibacillus sp. MBLB1832]